MHRLTVGLLALVVAGYVVGCQNQTPSPPKSVQPPTTPAIGDGTEQTTTPPTSQPSSEATQAPEESDSPPIAAVKAVLQGVDAGHLEVIADFLPDSYQQEVTALVRTFAEKMPEEFWSQLQTLAQKTVAVLKKHPQLTQPENIATAENAPFREKLQTALATLETPDIWSRNTWQSFELKSFLQGPGSAIFTAWQNLAATPASLTKETHLKLQQSEEDHAVIEFQSSLEAEPRPVEFVRIEGKWIPQSLSEGWAESVGKWSADLDRFDAAQVEKLAERIHPKLQQIERTLDQMATIDQSEKLQLGWLQIQSMLVQIRQEWAGAGPPPQVEIRVAGELTDNELTELLTQLIQIVDDPESAEYLTLPTATGTSIQLSPVEKIEEFVQRITFATVQRQDAGARTVDIERMPEK